MVESKTCEYCNEEYELANRRKYCPKPDCSRKYKLAKINHQYNTDPEFRAKKLAITKRWGKTEKGIEKKKAWRVNYFSKPENQEKHRKHANEYYARKKAAKLATTTEPAPVHENTST